VSDTIVAELSAAVRKAAAEVQHRAMRYQRDTIDVKARTVELAFASEEPYERLWGTEILSCTTEAADLARLNNRHPLLLNHDREEQIGVVERAWVDGDRKCRALVRFSRSAKGEEVFIDVQDGIRELVSVGYSIDDLVLESRVDGVDTYRVTRWTPVEVSIVSIPADTTVGVGRSLAPAGAAQPQEHRTMPDTVTAPAAAATTPPPATPDIRVITAQATADERQRTLDIRAMGDAHGLAELAEVAVREGTSAPAFGKQVLDKLVELKRAKPAAQSAEIGLSTKERQQFSVVRLMYALLEPGDSVAQQRAGFELECSRAARKLRPVDDVQGAYAAQRASGATIPVDVLGGALATERNAATQAAQVLQRIMAQRDLTVGTASAAGNLVATDLLASSFVDMLRNRLVLGALGITILDGLVGNVAIPTQTGGASTYWVTEGNAPTESQLTTGQITLTPKTVGMITDWSRKTLLQTTPAIEALVRADLAAGMATEIDRVGVFGSGTAPEPRGVANTAGIGAVAGGTNGAAPTYLHMIALEEQVAIANADVGNLAYLTNAKMRAQLKGTQQFSGTNGVPVWAGNEVNGYRAVASNQVPSNLTKGTSSGVCSGILFGNWRDLMLAMWGGLDLVLDPYALATSGGRRLIALQDVDVSVRRAASFAAMLDALRT
jgi:HK97 family phage major capsid protein